LLAGHRHFVSGYRPVPRTERIAKYHPGLQANREEGGSSLHCDPDDSRGLLGVSWGPGLQEPVRRSLTGCDELEADILILGAGGAGLLAALHAHERNRRLRIAIVVKGLLGQSGCTRMVQGGYNAVLHPADSLERHFEDTVKGGAFLNNQRLAWVLVEDAPKRVIELENKVGCLFDRNEDGTIHQKPFAGQSFDRTVHKGDLTGIEIMSNL